MDATRDDEGFISDEKPTWAHPKSVSWHSRWSSRRMLEDFMSPWMMWGLECSWRWSRVWASWYAIDILCVQVSVRLGVFWVVFCEEGLWLCRQSWRFPFGMYSNTSTPSSMKKKKDDC